jgi:phosphotriesterase-related protein
MAKQIMTVRGPINPDELGFASMHEHILTNVRVYRDLFEPEMPPPDPIEFPSRPNDPVRIEDLGYLKHGSFIHSEDNWDLENETLMTAEVSDFKTAGGDAILECSAPGIRGDAEGLRRISEATGVHIIASAGLYAEESVPDDLRGLSRDEYVRYLTDEIEHGVAGTDVKPGQIKSAVNHYSDEYGTFLQAAADVSNATGLMVTIHTGLQTSAEEHSAIVEAFNSAGMDPARLLFCHYQLTFIEREMKAALLDPDSLRIDLDAAKKILDWGANICIDLLGNTYDLEALGLFEVSDRVEVTGMIALIKAGYADQIVMGSDVFLKIQTRRYGGHGYLRPLNFVVPTLRAMEIPEDDICKITVKNPARLLGY